MRRAIVLLLLVPLAGCTTTYDLSGADWVKPNTMIQTVTLDEMECVRVAREAGFTPDLVVGGLADVGRVIVEERQRQAAYQHCMLAKGYRPAARSWAGLGGLLGL